MGNMCHTIHEKKIECFKNIELKAFYRYHIKNSISQIRIKYIRKIKIICNVMRIIFKKIIRFEVSNG